MVFKFSALIVVFIYCAIVVNAADSQTDGNVEIDETPATTSDNATTTVPETTIHLIRQLTNETFNQTIKENELVLIEFYAPWCGHCNALEPEYQLVAKQLVANESKIILAKVDGTAHPTLVTEHNIQGYPTLKLYRNGAFAVEYTGERTADNLSEWLTKKAEPALKTLTTPVATNAFINGTDVAVIIFTKHIDSQLIKDLQQLADSFDDIPFGWIANVDSFADYNVTEDGTIILFKKFDEKRTIFNGNSTNSGEIRKFIQIQSTPLISELNDKASQRIFDSELNAFLMLFISNAADGLTTIIEPLKSVARKYREKLFFVSIDADDEANHQMMAFLGADLHDIPCARIIRTAPEMVKFQPATNDAALTSENLEQFIDDYLADKLEPLKEDYIEDWGLELDPITQLHVNNFESIVFDPQKDVLVLYCAGSNVDCREFAPVYEQLGGAYQKYSSIIIAEIDLDEEHLDGIHIKELPTIRFFGRYTNHEVAYDGELNLRELMLFVEEQIAVGHAIDDERDGEYEEYDVRDEL